jgi:hypothetical protein
MVQIEQFIENIFPTQPRPAAIKEKTLTPEAAARAKAAEEEARRDAIYIGITVFFTLTIISAVMVRQCPKYTEYETANPSHRSAWPGWLVRGSTLLLLACENRSKQRWAHRRQQVCRVMASYSVHGRYILEGIYCTVTGWSNYSNI